jgi:ubiquinone/menaquinone biosynthesis C-methylase UbiE
VVGVHAARSAGKEAAFFLPHLRPGMRLLDVGCGPGTITLGLAVAVAPAEVIGVDLSETVLEHARVAASQAAAQNVRFERADATQLPYADSTFDAVFAHTLLEHVPDPLHVANELKRVLKPGGVIGVRDCDWGSRVYWPEDALVRQAVDLYARVWRHNGGHPNLGRRIPALLREAGFATITTSTSFRWDGSRDHPTNGSRTFGQLLAQRLLLPNFQKPIIENGWSDLKTLQNISQACTQWADHPDAYAAMIMTEGVATFL